MKTLFLSLLTASGCLFSTLSDSNSSMVFVKTTDPEMTPYIKQKKLEVLDSELESLENLRDYYTGKMSRYRNRAMRYELQGDNFEVAKHLSSEADKMEMVIKQIDEEIARLEKERVGVMNS